MCGWPECGSVTFYYMRVRGGERGTAIKNGGSLVGEKPKGGKL